MKSLQSKKNQSIPHHYNTSLIDREGMPPEDCPHWVLSDETINCLGLDSIDFDADYDTGEKDPHHIKKRKKRHSLGNTDFHSTLQQ